MSTTPVQILDDNGWRNAGESVSVQPEEDSQAYKNLLGMVSGRPRSSSEAKAEECYREAARRHVQVARKAIARLAEACQHEVAEVVNTVFQQLTAETEALREENKRLQPHPILGAFEGGAGPHRAQNLEMLTCQTKLEDFGGSRHSSKSGLIMDERAGVADHARFSPVLPAFEPQISPETHGSASIMVVDNELPGQLPQIAVQQLDVGNTIPKEVHMEERSDVADKMMNQQTASSLQVPLSRSDVRSLTVRSQLLQELEGVGFDPASSEYYSSEVRARKVKNILRMQKSKELSVMVSKGSPTTTRSVDATDPDDNSHGKNQLLHKDSLDSLTLPDKKVEEMTKPKAIRRRPSHRVFADVEALKERVRDTLHKPVYNVAAYYHEDGIFQRVARSPKFEQITLSIIALNALWISVETDLNKEASILQADPIFQLMEFFFVAFFTIEWGIRFLAFRNKVDGFKDAWFVFDTILVSIMIIDSVVVSVVFGSEKVSSQKHDGNSVDWGSSSVLRLARLIKLVRIAKLAHLLVAIPELLILIKGMAMATRSVLVTLGLLVIVIYIFGIIFTQLTMDTDLGDKYYATVRKSMATLLLHGCFGEDLPRVANDTGGDLPGGSLPLAVALMIFVLLASMTVMNMLVGVLVDVVSTVSKVEKEEISVNLVKNHLMQIIDSLDGNKNGAISKLEFEALLEKPKAARALQDVGVDVVALIDLEDYLFSEEGELPVAEFMETVLQLRGSNRATVRDVVDLRKVMSQEIKNMQERMLIALGMNPAQAMLRLGMARNAGFLASSPWNSLDEDRGGASDSLGVASAGFALFGMSKSPQGPRR